MLLPMRKHRYSAKPSAGMTFGKRPRQYAAEIIALPMREQRQRALAEVPDDLRDWVREYVEDYFAKRRCLDRYLRDDARRCTGDSC